MNEDGGKAKGSLLKHSYSGGSPKSGRISPDSGSSDKQGSKDDEVLSLLKEEEQKSASEYDDAVTKSSEKNMSEFEMI